MTVTDVAKTKKGRYALFVDDEFLFSIHSDSFFKTKLAVGLQLTVQELEELRQQDQLLSAKAAAMDTLSRAAQSSGILLQKLTRYYDPEAAEAAVERMTELGLVDDADYARRLAADGVNLRGYSMARVRQVLRQKKLPPEVIEAALESFEDRDESEPIITLLLKKYREKLFDRDDLRKVVAALQRKGFSYNDIKTALNRIEDEELWRTEE